jgi:hypothetical protein
MRHPWPNQVVIIQANNARPESLMARCEPIRNRRKRPLRDRFFAGESIPSQLAIAESAIVIHELGLSDVPDDIPNRAVSSRRNPDPIRWFKRADITQQRGLVFSMKSFVEEKQILGNCRMRHCPSSKPNRPPSFSYASRQNVIGNTEQIFASTHLRKELSGVFQPGIMLSFDGYTG